jgi:uncharacterized protein YjiS (DUF1127 family)
MHSNSQALATDGYAMAKTNAAMDAANQVVATLDAAAIKAGDILRRYAEARRRHREMVDTIRLLSSLDDHQLRDIGVERGQIVEICRQNAE